MSPASGRALSPMRWLLALLIPVLLCGCLPIPDVQVDLAVAPPDYFVPPGEIEPEYVLVAGHPVEGTPAEYNRSAYLRYAVVEDPHTILLLMPGIFGGAASFDEFARQVVAS